MHVPRFPNVLNLLIIIAQDLWLMIEIHCSPPLISMLQIEEDNNELRVN